MIGLFNSNRPVLLAGLLVCTLIVYVISALNPAAILTDVTASTNSVFQFIYSMYPLAVLLSISITFATAVLLNRFVHDMGIMPKSSYVPGLLFVACSCLSTHFLMIDVQHLINLLLVLMLGCIAIIYNNQNQVGGIFNLGLLIGISILLAPYAIILVLLLPLTLSTTRSFIFKEWAVGFLGLLTPLFWAWSLLFVTDSWMGVANYFHAPVLIFSKAFIFDSGILSIACYVFLMLLGALWYVQDNYMKSQIQIRKHLLIVLILLPITLVSTGLSGGSGLQHFIILSVPLSIILSYFLLNIKRRKFAEWIFGIFIALILFFQYFPLLFNMA